MRLIFMTKKYRKRVSLVSSLKSWAALALNMGMALSGARNKLFIFYCFQHNLLIYYRVEVHVVPIQNPIIKCYSTPRVVTKHWNDYVPDSKGYIFLANFESESDTPPDKKCMKSV